MSSSSPNLELNYLYRDASNNKSRGSVVFSNRTGLSLDAIQRGLRAGFVDLDHHFECATWALPSLYEYPYDPELDHGWHEYDRIMPTDAAPTHGDITELIERIHRSCGAGDDEMVIAGLNTQSPIPRDEDRA